MGFEFPHHGSDIFLLGIAVSLSETPATQIDHDPHIQLIHFRSKLIDFGLIDASLMAVNINEGKLCTGDGMLRNLERGGGIVFFKAHFLGLNYSCMEDKSD